MEEGRAMRWRFPQGDTVLALALFWHGKHFASSAPALFFDRAQPGHS
jgi:hypothetical protein